ncbi:MAG: glycosyltransferase family 2 protein [Candidatus Marinamargulisbacteria bacterium]
MDISVVIGSYNQCDRLKRVLDGYSKQVTQLAFEVIVVDSFSTDGTADMVANITPSLFQLNFIQRENPSGKAEARNAGVAVAKSDIIVISDADMVPGPDFVQAHYTAHQTSQDVSCFEGLAYNLDSYDWPPSVNDKHTQVPTKYRHGDVLDWYYFLTGNISFPKSLFVVEKGFSLDFKNYGWEDLELGYRFKKRGIPLRYIKTAINYHYHVISDKEKAERKFNMGQSAQIFMQKHPELKLFLGLNPISVFIRKRLSRQNIIFRMIYRLRDSKTSALRSFSYWFLGEYNYLSGLLNLSND